MFLAPKVPNLGGSDEQRLLIRRQYLEKHIYDMEANQTLRKHLIEECGYSPDLWKGNIYMAVDIELRSNVEENFHSALLGCYGYALFVFILPDIFC